MKFELDEKKLLDLIDKSIMVWFNILENEVKNAVPRDKNRLPNPIILKKKLKPERNIRKNNKHFYRLPVQINGAWYEWVTWNLARSISSIRLWIWEYQVWVLAWITEEYAKVQEFWSRDWKIKKRSFLLEPLLKNQEKIINQIEKTFTELLNK